MSNVTEADRRSFDEEVFDPSIPVVVEFRTDWCEICEELEPVVEELADEYEDTIKVVTVDVAEEGRLANDYHVADVPTFIGFYRGNSLERRAGRLSADDVEEIFETFLNLPRVAA